jgi:hypothetical protein
MNWLKLKFGVGLVLTAMLAVPTASADVNRNSACPEA